MLILDLFFKKKEKEYAVIFFNYKEAYKTSAVNEVDQKCRYLRREKIHYIVIVEFYLDLYIGDSSKTFTYLLANPIPLL